MRFVSWNVNGIRACLKKGFAESMLALDADAIGLQEVKCQEATLPDEGLGYPYAYYNFAEKKGYSGTALYCRLEPINVVYDIPGHDTEGRVITLEYSDYYLVNVYVPNSGDALKRLDYRTAEWEPTMRAYLTDLAKHKEVIFCGDLNVAHKEMDLKNPATNRRSAGFTDEEREQLGLLLDAGFIDTFRFKYPDKEDAYTWWSYRTRARERNAGWRIDYFLISEGLKPSLKDAVIHADIFGSDHCPVSVTMDL